jgi:hypothetical protein
MLGEIPKSHIKNPTDVSLAEWRVDAVPLCVADLAELRPALVSREAVSGDGRFLADGVMAALDLCYIMECCSFALSLLERGKFLPDIKMSGDGAKYEPIWRPMLTGDDAARYGRLVRGMPDIIRTRACPQAAMSETALREMMTGLVDGLVRHAWVRRIAEKNPASQSRGIARAITKNSFRMAASAPERRRRGKLVNALNPHVLWIRSLGWFGETDGLSQSLESIYRDVREWRSRYEWFSHAPFKLRLEMADDEDSRWRLGYSLRILGSGDIIDSADVWGGRGQASSPASGNYMRRYLMLMLGRTGASFSPIGASLGEASPLGCALSLEETADFLQNHASDMSAMGVEIEYPSWWTENSPDLLTIRGMRDKNSKFTWRLAWRGTALSDEEYAAIARDPSPLSRIRGGWIFIPPDYLELLRRHIAMLPETLSHIEAIRLAIRDPYIDGFVDMPEIEAAYRALRSGNPLELFEAPEKMTGSLRPYQERGFSWMSFLTDLGIGACLADDMGLGKTVQTLALVQRCRDTGHARPVLLVCPTSVLENWRLEMGRFFPGMTCYVHHGKDRFRGRMFTVTAQRSAMVLSSYMLLHRDAEEYRSVDWLGVVLDEAQNIKNPDTHTARAARSVKSDWRVALTGTPIENHVGDIWSIMEFLMPGMLGSRKRFADRYVRPLAESPDPRIASSLRKAISPFIMRRLKTDPEIAPELPLKIETKVFCGLKKEQIKLYANVTDELSRNIGGADGIKRKGLILAGITRMKQICDHPMLFSHDRDMGRERSSKLERMISLAEEMFETGDRALIFTQYVEMGHILKYQLQECFGKEVLFLHGAIPKGGRDRMVRRFQEGSGPQFFVLSLRAGGVGLNLTRANHVVMYDRWWNPAVETQAIDRAYRIGQTSNVQVHIFCCKGTLEERIDEIISSKKTLADSVIWESDNWITEMSDRELRNLVSLSPRALDA